MSSIDLTDFENMKELLFLTFGILKSIKRLGFSP